MWARLDAPASPAEPSRRLAVGADQAAVAPMNERTVRAELSG